MTAVPVSNPAGTPHQADATRQFAADVLQALAQRPRQLPSRYLYDALGSALFDAICRLPWYPLTRAELRLLDRHGEAILAACRPLTDLVELGPGNGEKLVALLRTRHDADSPLRVHLVDISRAALTLASGLVAGLPGIEVVTHQATYHQGLEAVSREQTGDGATLALFLGSNIGNFDPPDALALLRQLHDALRPGDLFLLGADLVKDEAVMREAYQDPLGVTAAFNRNLLVRLNRELGADFDIDGFVHRAEWNAQASRMESYLVSTRRQRVTFPGGEVITFEDGERIWTESSYKFTVDGVFALLEDAGFTRRHAWVDEQDRFALTLVGR